MDGGEAKAGNRIRRVARAGKITSMIGRGTGKTGRGDQEAQGELRIGRTTRSTVITHN